MANTFHIHFDNDDYNQNGWDILPDVDEYLKYDEIVNYEEYKKGNIDNCVWRREEDPIIITQQYVERELRRILRTGIFICIKDEIFWIPPNYYFFLRYSNAGGDAPEFRIKRLKHVYFKLWVRKNPFAIGTYTIKNRQDGETTMSMSDSLWEAADGISLVGTIGVQSKTTDTVISSCWRTLLMQWNGLPQWVKDHLFPDYISEDKNARKMKFMSPKQDGKAARDMQILWGSSSHNAFDSLNNMRKCILDEVNKWIEAEFYKTFINYEQFIAPAMTRKGLFDIFSSPADTNGKHNDQAHLFWKGSDWSNLANLKHMTTDTRVFRYYSNPLEGIEGAYDKFGDADPNVIMDEIIRKRRTKPKEFLMEEIRAYPLNEEEMFGSFDGGSIWTNHEGIQNRKIFLMNRRFKSEVTKEPVKVFGNLEWPQGMIDYELPIFRQADTTTFDVDVARWCFSYLPAPEEQRPLKKTWNDNLREYRFAPPKLIQNSLGIDPYGKRHPHSGHASNGAMVNRKFLDFFNTGIVNCPTMIYDNRPQHETTFYEDAIKSALFLRAKINPETVTHGLVEHIEDRGYFDWLLPARGERQGSKKIGDNPSGRGGYLNEGIALLNAALNVPINEDDPYPLELHWFAELLEDETKFNPKDTLKSNLTMADMQSLLGIVKMIMMRQSRKPKKMNRMALDYLFS